MFLQNGPNSWPVVPPGLNIMYPLNHRPSGPPPGMWTASPWMSSGPGPGYHYNTLPPQPPQPSNHSPQRSPYMAHCSTTNGHVPSPGGQGIIFQLHKFWHGRVAPLPGQQVMMGSRYLPGQNQIVRRAKPSIQIPQADTSKQNTPDLLLRARSTTDPSNGLKPTKRNKLKPSEAIEVFPILTDEGSGFEFDKYAEEYIPLYLQKIQNKAHSYEPLAPVPTFPPPSLLPSLFDKHEHHSTHTPTILMDPPASAAPSITVDYGAHWKSLLAWELGDIADDKQRLVLWQKTLRAPLKNWERGEFIMHSEGLRENYPRLQIQDLVHLREVLVDTMSGTGRAFEGRVLALRKREGFVHIFCPSLRNHIKEFGEGLQPYPSFDTGDDTTEGSIRLSFNVSFLTNALPYCVMQTSAGVVSEHLKRYPNGVSRRWLFPEGEDLLQSPYPPLVEPEWVDKGLNQEQRLAVASIARRTSCVPFLIRGPPGTGKTRTIVETVRQILLANPDACIILCAPSNPATDTLVLQLRDHLKPDEMFRLNEENRTFAQVSDKIMPYCYVQHDRFALPSWDTVMKFRVVVTACMDAAALYQFSNTATGRLERTFLNSMHPRQTLPYVAAQGSEPELLVPISVMLTDPHIHGTALPQLVLCGDPHQLGPIVTSDEARKHELDVSLLERLFERPLYARVPSLKMPWMHLPSPFTNLVRNYRSHPAILMTPSAMFYNDSLEPCAQNGTISWSKLPNKALPLVFYGEGTTDSSVDERASWHNTGEIHKIIDTIRSLLQEADACDPPLKASEIGVMAPWRGQVWKIRERLRKEGLSAVDVGTVEDYQGRESRVIIISCVRSSARFIPEDAKKGLGLIGERKRMNVAITRARELLVVIGSASLLTQDPYWKSLLEFATRNNLYVGPKLKDIELNGNYISRLE